MFARRGYGRRGYRRATPVGSSRFVQDTVANKVPTATQNTTQREPVIQSTSVSGVRKTRGFDLEFVSGKTCVYALVYFPEGITPSNAVLTVSGSGASASLYAPEQHIILSGLSRPNVVTRARATIGRNLSSGDSVFLLFMNLDGNDPADYVVFRVSLFIAFG
jgi:hypothetical protein